MRVKWGMIPTAIRPSSFSKPADALLTGDADLPYPPQTSDLHFEAELVVAIGLGGVDIPVQQALQHIWGYAAGNDFTRRDLQAVAKRMGRPWDLAKGFDLSAACGVLHPASHTGDLSHGSIRLSVDGETRQQGNLAEMIWSVPEVISYLSGFIALAPGDLIYTGTPAGVGAVIPGQTVTVEIAGLTPLVTRIMTRVQPDA